MGKWGSACSSWCGYCGACTTNPVEEDVTESDEYPQDPDVESFRKEMEMIEPTDVPTPLLHFIEDEQGEFDVHDATDVYLGYITDKRARVFVAHDRALFRPEELHAIASFIEELKIKEAKDGSSN